MGPKELILRNATEACGGMRMGNLVEALPLSAALWLHHRTTATFLCCRLKLQQQRAMGSCKTRGAQWSTHPVHRLLQKCSFLECALFGINMLTSLATVKLEIVDEMQTLLEAHCPLRSTDKLLTLYSHYCERKDDSQDGLIRSNHPKS